MSSQSQLPVHANTLRINEMRFILPVLSPEARRPTDGIPAISQPFSLSLLIRYGNMKTEFSDGFESTIDHAKLTQGLQERLKKIPPSSTLDHVVAVVCDFVVKEYSDSFELDVIQRKGFFLCESLMDSYTSVLVHGKWKVSRIQQTIKDLVCFPILGMTPQERETGKEVRITVDVTGDGIADLENPPKGQPSVSQSLREIINQSQYLTLEALASDVAKRVVSMCYNGVIPIQAKIRVWKQRETERSESTEVVICRSPLDYANSVPFTPSALAKPTKVSSKPANTSHIHTAVLALGSNLGDRFQNIEYALRLLEIPRRILREKRSGTEDFSSLVLRVVNTSFLYETAPMYLTDQPAFINGACVVETNLAPLTLLRLVKAIESIVGRIPSIQNGPRAIDLDIIFFDTLVNDTRPALKKEDIDDREGHLIIPHPRLAEREFVLRPLNDIISDFCHPVSGQSVAKMLQQLECQPDQRQMQKVIPFPRLPLGPEDTCPYPSVPPIPRTSTYWTYSTAPPMQYKTQLMATLNTTPDSFSDGSTHNSISKALEYVHEAVSAGSSIVDIGGCSTRPGAGFVPVEEEIERVLPFVKAIREFDTHKPGDDHADRVKNILISVDTFRPEVAEAALNAGVNCINDVYAFTGADSYGREDERPLAVMQEMKRIAKKFAAPVVLMHSRGDAGQNKDYSMHNYAGPKGAVLEGIKAELGDKVNKIVTGKGALRRWLVIVDPGIGFSKTVEANLYALRNASQITTDKTVGKGDCKRRNSLQGFPQLIGTSRKSFLGTILSQREGGRETTPKERKWATAAAVACSIQQGALVARVHDVKEIHDVVQISDALWRTEY